MSKNEHYRIVLEDTEEKIIQLEAECYELENQLEMRRSLIAEAEHTKMFIQNTLLPEVQIEEKQQTDFVLIPHDRRTALEKLQDWKEDVIFYQYTETNESPVTLGDGCEVILEVFGSALHADRLADELKEIGRFKLTKNVVATIKTDAQKRFINLGGNIWDLRRRHPQPQEEVKEDEREIDIVE